jgi:hypothetical protein
MMRTQAVFDHVEDVQHVFVSHFDENVVPALEHVLGFEFDKTVDLGEAGQVDNVMRGSLYGKILDLVLLVPGFENEGIGIATTFQDIGTRSTIEPILAEPTDQSVPARLAI